MLLCSLTFSLCCCIASFVNSLSLSLYSPSLYVALSLPHFLSMLLSRSLTFSLCCSIASFVNSLSLSLSLCHSLSLSMLLSRSLLSLYAALSLPTISLCCSLASFVNSLSLSLSLPPSLSLCCSLEIFYRVNAFNVISSRSLTFSLCCSLASFVNSLSLSHCVVTHFMLRLFNARIGNNEIFYRVNAFKSLMAHCVVTHFMLRLFNAFKSMKVNRPG